MDVGGSSQDAGTTDRLAGLGKRLAGGFVFITTSLAAVGVAAGDLERVLRNNPGEALFWFALVGVGIAAGLIVAYTPSDRDQEHEFKGAGLAFVVLGVLGVFAALFWERISMLPAPFSAGRTLAIAVALGAAVGGAIWLVRTSRSSPAGEADKERTYWGTVVLTACLVLVFLAATAQTARAMLTGAVATLLFAGLLRAIWPPHVSLRAMVLVVGFLSFLGGVLGVFRLTVENTSAKDRPMISASISADSDGRLELTAMIEATGLRVDEHVFVIVEGLSSSSSLSAARAGRSVSDAAISRVFGNDAVQTLYISSVGPDRNGSVSLPVTVQVSPGLYERVRVNAFLETPEPDALAKLEQLQGRNDMEAARREQHDIENDVHRLDEKERLRREEYETEHGGILDEEERKRREDLYWSRIDEEERKNREDFDQAIAQAESDLRRELEEEALLDVRCNPSPRTRGCAILLLPEAENRPSVNVVPVLAGETWALEILLRVRGLSADDAVLLSVYGRSSDEERYAQHFYSASLAPGLGGSLTDELVVPLLDATVQAVCVTGEILQDARGRPRELYQPEGTCAASDFRVSTAEVILPRRDAPESRPTSDAGKAGQ